MSLLQHSLERTAEPSLCLQASAEHACVYTMRDELKLNPCDTELTAPQQRERKKSTPLKASPPPRQPATGSPTL